LLRTGYDFLEKGSDTFDWHSAFAVAMIADIGGVLAREGDRGNRRLYRVAALLPSSGSPLNHTTHT